MGIRRARRALTGKTYAWGDELKPGGKWMANIYKGQFPVKDTGEDGFAGIAPVGQFPPNGYGLYDMAGNVWQWCSDWYRPDYYARLKLRGRRRGAQPARPGQVLRSRPMTSRQRVHRGGSFLCTDQYCTRYMMGTRGKGDIDTGQQSPRLPLRQGPRPRKRRKGKTVVLKPVELKPSP